MTNLLYSALVILKVWVSTNHHAGYFIGPDIGVLTNGDGYIQAQMVPAILVAHPPHDEVVTNYVIGVRIGTNQIELLTLSTAK